MCIIIYIYNYCNIYILLWIENPFMILFGKDQSTRIFTRWPGAFHTDFCIISHFLFLTCWLAEVFTYFYVQVPLLLEHSASCGIAVLHFPLGFPGGSRVKNPLAMQETQVRSLGREDPLEKDVRPVPEFLPGKSRGERSLVGCSP